MTTKYLLLTAVALTMGLAREALGAASQAQATGRPAASVWAIEVPYGNATAHQPNFADKNVWPFLTGKEYFLKTQWPKPSRTLVWGHPGKNAGQRTDIDPQDPKSWTDLATGKPAETLPDATTDVIVPGAAKKYTVDWQNAGHGHKDWGPPLEARHVTLGPNARLLISDAKIRGNIWVQRGGGFIVDVTLHMLGPEHTFFRNDNAGIAPGTDGSDGTYMCQYLMFNKATPEASVEFLGTFHSGDEFQAKSGTLIVGPDSVVEMGREAGPYIEKGATFALLDNGYLAKWTNDLHVCDLHVRGGTLQGGLPDRPLTRSAVVRLGHKNFTAAKYTQPVGGDEGRAERAKPIQRVAGMAFQAGSTLRSYSTDVKKARLIITQLPAEYPMTFHRPALDTREYEQLARSPQRKAYMEWLTQLPQGIDVAIADGVSIDGVEFDHLRKGGLMIQPKARAEMKNVFWGQHNLASGEELFGELPRGLVKGTQY